MWGILLNVDNIFISKIKVRKIGKEKVEGKARPNFERKVEVNIDISEKA